jgi:hypothetical protein
MFRGCPLLLLAAVVSQAATPEWAAKVAAHAEQFARKSGGVWTVETLVQRAYNLPPHRHFAIGAAAEPLYARYLVHEVVSEYSIGPLKTGKGDSHTVVEYREIVSFDGKPVQQPAISHNALARSVNAGELRARKRMLEELTKLGLIDVATDYGLLLLAFTTEAQKGIEWSEAGAAFVGVDEALVFEWRQTSGGALSFLDGKTAVHPMGGRIWIRRSDGAPLRVRASFSHVARGRTIRDDASVDYIFSNALGCVAPASVVHRHAVNDVVLTENLYTYEPFHLFTTDTKIEFVRPAATSGK